MKKYCVIMLHYNGAEYAEVIHCPFQIPDEAVYSGSFKECENINLITLILVINKP